MSPVTAITAATYVSDVVAFPAETPLLQLASQQHKTVVTWT
ncbi:hypothetical protein [Pectobacterium punjabense]|nr:hypothetical protein [Pectobacterium punjabense]